LTYGYRVLVRSDRVYQFDAGPEAFWAAITKTGSYRAWWPWLRMFDAQDFEVGSRWTCAVQPPVPYRVRFTIDFTRIERPSLVTVAVGGDIHGTASLDITPDGTGSTVRLVSELIPDNRALRAAAFVARPVVRFGHDWVLDTGARQFAAFAF
jgi:uncharacterized protein YndB with AHSA1/START domain